LLDVAWAGTGTADAAKPERTTASNAPRRMRGP
jgi:hypothetical protein